MDQVELPLNLPLYMKQNHYLPIYCIGEPSYGFNSKAMFLSPILFSTGTCNKEAQQPSRPNTTASTHPHSQPSAYGIQEYKMYKHTKSIYKP